jgi:hypothetical protein
MADATPQSAVAAAPVAGKTMVTVPTRLVVVRAQFDLGGAERKEVEDDALFAARVDRRKPPEGREMLQAPFMGFSISQMLASVAQPVEVAAVTG